LVNILNGFTVVNQPLRGLQMKPKGKVLGKSRDLVITASQLERLNRLKTGKGGNQSLFERISARVKTSNSQTMISVYDVDYSRLRELAVRDDEGSWQDWAREVLAQNP